MTRCGSWQKKKSPTSGKIEWSLIISQLESNRSIGSIGKAELGDLVRTKWSARRLHRLN